MDPQNSPEEEAELKKLKDMEKSVEQTVKKLETVDGELTGLRNVSCGLDEQIQGCPVFAQHCAPVSQGFLAKDLQAQALEKLDKRVKAAAEQLVRILEQIDAMVRSLSLLKPVLVETENHELLSPQSVPEGFSDCRMKKKGLVKTVQVSWTPAVLLETISGCCR